MRFQFSPAKATSNLRKHGVSFADAEGVFYDTLAIHCDDPEAKGEERFVAVGMGSAAQAKFWWWCTRCATTKSV
jgi:hypothetical protein